MWYLACGVQPDRFQILAVVTPGQTPLLPRSLIPCFIRIHQDPVGYEKGRGDDEGASIMISAIANVYKTLRSSDWWE